jgi:hypothetical protein
VAENVFHVAQIAPQSGTMAALGSSVAAITILPVTEVISPELDRGTAWAQEDYGRNITNHAGRGYHGVRAATWSMSGEVTFEQVMHLLEMQWAGGVTPVDADPLFTWVYPFEAGAPTVIPYTIETGSETGTDQYELVGCLIDELTLTYDALAAPGASPWTFEASGLAVDRVVAALTSSLSSTAVETWQGHLTTLAEGATSTAFASLSALTASLVQFGITTRKHLVLRPYGSATDIAGKMGFTEKASGEITAMIAHSATAKTNIHDIYNVSGSIAGERRWRVSVNGTGTNQADLDMRLGFMQVERGERDGESTYEVTAELVDDSTLGAAAQWTIANSIEDLTPA